VGKAQQQQSRQQQQQQGGDKAQARYRKRLIIVHQAALLQRDNPGEVVIAKPSPRVAGPPLLVGVMGQGLKGRARGLVSLLGLAAAGVVAM
jgi:hypothetical protein